MYIYHEQYVYMLYIYVYTFDFHTYTYYMHIACLHIYIQYSIMCLYISLLTIVLQSRLPVETVGQKSG